MTASRSRRQFAVGVAALVAGCRPKRNADPATEQRSAEPPNTRGTAFSRDAETDDTSHGELREHLFDFASSPVGPERAVALVAADSGPKDLPVLVALHGRGEAVRGLDVGARAWRDDYWLDRAIANLRRPPLAPSAFQGLIEPARLQRINASLAERPFRGMVVVCPWVPDLLTERERTRLDGASPFGAFVVDQLLPAVVAKLGASSARGATGIDGVSLGGRVSLLAGFERAHRFGAIGSLQAAIQNSEAPALTERAQRAADATPVHLRLVTSEKDYFRGAIGHLHTSLEQAKVAHELLTLPGPHDYVWNRGPGAIEMLLWHDRVLRDEPPL